MQPDARLATLAGEGSEPAFEEIVRRYRSRLVAFAAAIVPAHRAEDIVQESLEKAFGALRESAGEVQLKAWLYTIVRNRALNAVRDERVHVELDEQYDGVTPPPEILARREEVAALVAGLQALPEAQRQALLGRELEGLSHADIAARMGTSPTSVRGLIFRARTAVRHAAGALIPLPAVRWMLGEGAATPGAGDAATGASLAAAGVASASAGGGGIAVKAGAVLVAGVLAAGAGVGLRSGSDSKDSTRAEAAQTQDGPGDAPTSRSVPGRGQSEGAGNPGADQPGSGNASGAPGGDAGEGHTESGDRSGPGGGDGGGSGSSSGPGGHSGPGGGGGADDPDDHSGPGSGGEPEEPAGDHSGAGGGGGHSGPGGDSGPGGGDDEVPEPPDEPADDPDDDGHHGGHSGPGGGDEPADTP
jgi:RNA polymerase sigma factor (sigma-70 family)